MLLCFFLGFFGRDVSSFFLAEISLQMFFLRRDFSSIFFGREMSLETNVLVEIVRQMFIWQGMSLQSFLGRIFPDNFW